jgi:DNA-binding LacI/PurR family transcriptional regulator
VQSTIADVARHAGVAPSTVSYVLTGNRRISAETRERVEASIRALSYRPHAGARSMRNGRTDVIGLVVPIYQWSTIYQWSAERILMPYVCGVVESARRHGWNVMLLTAEDGKADIEQVVRSQMIDGLILMEVLRHDERVPLVAELGMPAVLLGVPDNTSGLPYVDFDFEGAGRLCVKHLVGLGHQEIGFLGPPQGVFDRGLGYAFRAWNGVAEELAERGLLFHGIATEPMVEGVQSALGRLFDETPALTALVVHSEGVLNLVIERLTRLAKQVPEDVSVIAIAHHDLALQVRPTLTHVRVPADEMGRQAVQLLSSWDGTGPGRLLPPSLVRGQSSSPPSRAHQTQLAHHGSEVTFGPPRQPAFSRDAGLGAHFPARQRS